MFICPLTKALMVNPVITRYGNNYEHSALATAITKDGMDPIAKKTLKNSRKEITENRLLQQAIKTHAYRLHPELISEYNKANNIGFNKQNIIIENDDDDGIM